MSLNDFRKEKKLTVEELAQKTGFSISAIAKMLYGERQLSGNFLKRLKKVFPEIDINELIG